MPPSPFEIVSSAPLRLPALNIGIWMDDTRTDLVCGDAVMAGIFGLTESEAAEGISRTRLTSIFHPDDFARDTDRRRQVRDEGGLFAWEHRIVPAPGIVRWVLARGRFDRYPDGHVRGRGIVIDVTDSRTDGHVDGPAQFMTAQMSETSPLSLMADHALALWKAADRLEAEQMAYFHMLLKPLLHEIGRQLAISCETHREQIGPARRH